MIPYRLLLHKSGYEACLKVLKSKGDLAETGVILAYSVQFYNIIRAKMNLQKSLYDWLALLIWKNLKKGKLGKICT